MHRNRFYNCCRFPPYSMPYYNPYINYEDYYRGAILDRDSVLNPFSYYSPNPYPYYLNPFFY